MEGGVLTFGLARLALAVFFIGSVLTARGGEPPERPLIMVTLFPQYDFARRIAGDRCEVRMLLPPGAESHSYEPSPSDMKAIAGAALFIYTSDVMEPWAARLAEAAGSVRVVNASAGLLPENTDEGAPHSHDNGEHGHDGEHEHFHEFDPHIWLDPVIAAGMTENIAQAFSGLDPENAEVYRRNAAGLQGEILKLDEEFRAAAASAKRRTLVFADRFAFAHFFSRYGLEHVGPYRSCAPGAEPGLRAVLDTIQYIKENDVRILYQEHSFGPGRTAQTIMNETGLPSPVNVSSLHEGWAGKQYRSYTELMRENMRAFARGLQ